MNKREQDYAMDRIDGISCRKLEAIKAALPVIKPKRINYRQAVALIKQGKILLNPNYPKRELYPNDDFEDVFDVTKHHQSKNCFKAYDEAKYEKKAAPIYNEARRIKDQIMLGDAAEGLKLIEQFMKM